MPIFQRQLLTELIINALVTFAVITLIFLVGGSLQTLHKSDFLTLPLFVRLVLFFVGTNLDKTLPMTVLIAVVLTFGRAAAENEINTMRASGVHLYTAFAPALLFGLIGSATVLHVNDRIAPIMEFTKKDVIESGLDSAVAALMDHGGNGIELSKDLQVIWRSVDEQNRLLDVRIKRYARGDDDGRPLSDEIMASSARLETDTKRGILYLNCEGVKTLHGEFQQAAAGSLRYPIPLRDEVREKKLSHHTFEELIAAKDRRYDGAPKPRKIVSEFHQRLAGAGACLLFVLIGVPLAIIFRQSNRMVAFLIAFLIALVVFYPTFILGDLLAEETDLPPVLAIWSGSIVLLLLGLGLTWVVLRR